MKVAKRPLLGLLLVLLLTAPLSALAQDDDKEGWVEYVAENELFTLSHPEGWFISYDPDDLLFFYLANSEETLEKVVDSSEVNPESGEKAIAGFFMPAELVPLMIGAEVPEDATPDAVVELLVTAFTQSSEDEREPSIIGEAEVLELEDGLEAGAITIQDVDDETDGVMIVWQEEDIVYIATAVAYTGEFDEELRDLVIEIMMTLELDTEAFAELVDAAMGGTGSSN